MWLIRLLSSSSINVTDLGPREAELDVKVEAKAGGYLDVGQSLS